MEPWEEYPDIWSTKAKFFSYLRGNLRRAVWNRWPGKIRLKSQQCSPPPEGMVTRARTGTECALTGEWQGKSRLEVDHIEGNVSLNDWEDVVPFIQHLCAPMDNLQLVSKEAHKIKSYAEKHGLSFEEAAVKKEFIKFKKLSKKAKLLALDIKHPTVVAAVRVKDLDDEWWRRYGY